MYTIITGPTSGIGLELAHIFARANKNLILVGRDQKKLNEVKENLTNKKTISVLVFAADLSIQSQVEQLCSQISASNLQIENIVNNAGFGDFAEFKDSNLPKIMQMIEVNITTLTYITHRFLPQIIAAKGKILNLSSTAAFQAGPYMAVYFATKAYVLSFSEALAEELEPLGVSVTALCPGPTISNFASTAEMGSSNLFKSPTLPTSKEVAEFGYKSMMNRQRVAIHGIRNKFMIFLERFVPRILVTKLVKNFQSPSK